VSSHVSVDGRSSGKPFIAMSEVTLSPKRLPVSSLVLQLIYEQIHLVCRNQKK